MSESMRARLDQEVVLLAPSMEIMDVLSKANTELDRHERVMASISGGADSDVVLDVLYKLDYDGKVTYVYFGTGLEYDATKRHLDELEQKYGIKIERVKPSMPIPTCCKKYGVPFWNKRVSELIYRLQKHGFKWEDKPFDVLIQEYPRCRAALRWWCNEYPKRENGSESSLNIAYTPFLKEWMMLNPPPKISAKCCQKAKKEPAEKYEKEHDFDMVCIGVRKAEKGPRSMYYKNCFTRNIEGADDYRPIFWLTDKDKQEYKEHYCLRYSDCYEVWGMDRTGCPGCPYGKFFEQELEFMQKYEPKFYKAALKIFGPSYEYTRGYLKFREEMKNRKGVNT